MKLNESLIQWYKENQRDLPFRQSRDPYAIWVSEIMAQQTRIDSMLPYYKRWMERWPSIEALASAEIGEILSVWQGLGYYNRARKLHEGAKKVVLEYGGRLPADVKELEKIPGIGFYTAGAIASIAYGIRAPAVDGNVLRVTARINQIGDDISKKSTVDRVYQIVYDWMGNSDPSYFTQGLMEIGALVCTPKNPGCLLCPLKEYCQSAAEGTQSNYPYKKASKRPQELTLYTYYITNSCNQLLISCDWSDGLMEGLFRLPQFETIPPALQKAEFVGKRKHVFSHRIWNMNCYVFQSDTINLEKTFWVSRDELSSLALVTAHRKWIKERWEEEK